MENSSKLNYFNDIKELTNQIQKGFCSETDDENTHWLLLKNYYSSIILTKEFDKIIATSYSSVLSTLLDVLKPTLFTEKWQEDLFDNVFLHGIHHQSFLVLVKRLEQSEAYVIQKIADLLLKFVQGSSFESLFIYQCISNKHWDIRYVSKSNIWDDLITAVVSLPERIANKTRGKFVKLFSPATFIPLVLSSVFKVLKIIYKLLRESEDTKEQECSLEFLSKLAGRICIVGHADIVAKFFFKKIIRVSKSDFVWRRISQNFIAKMPSNSLDSFITSLLLEIPWYGNVEWILGDEGVKNGKINYLMTVKLLFYRNFKHVVILQNAIGYFACSSSRCHQFITIFNLLLDSWMDKGALKHQSLEQKIYIASAIMICAGWLKNLKPEFDNKEYIKKVLEGVQIRLESSEETVRSLGLIVGGHLLKSLDPDCHPLEYECADLDLVNRLTSLMEIPSNTDISLSKEDLKCFKEVESKSKQEQKPDKNEVNCTTEELESDDDLEPYDMSHDIPVSEQKRPLYLRDCMMGLMDQDAEWAEKCMKHAEELIKADSYATEEVAEEMAKIVLHLGNTLSIPDFVALRHRILITLTAQCPVLISSYLISQFAEKDYTIRQRLDILEVLAASSALLSTTRLPAPETPPNALKECLVEKEPNWQMVIRKRLEAKTKYYTKAQTPAFKENKFSAVCGNFFYPLLNSYERACQILKLHDRDSYVLGRFIYTLGIIMYYASNTLHCSQMALTLLQFLSTLRSHKDEFVRKCIIFAVSATYTAVPPPILFSKEMLLQDVTETSEWLQSVAENDPDSSCVEKAFNALSILRSVAAEDPVISQLKNLIL